MRVVFGHGGEVFAFWFLVGGFCVFGLPELCRLPILTSRWFGNGPGDGGGPAFFGRKWGLGVRKSVTKL
jgi:hypothetical protein